MPVVRKVGGALASAASCARLGDEMSELAQVFEDGVRVVLGGAEPNDQPLGRLEDFTEPCDLHIPFGNIPWVDAEGLDPDESGLVPVPELAQGLGELGCCLAAPRVDKYRNRLEGRQIAPVPRQDFIPSIVGRSEAQEGA